MCVLCIEMQVKHNCILKDVKGFKAGREGRVFLEARICSRVHVEGP